MASGFFTFEAVMVLIEQELKLLMSLTLIISVLLW